MASESISFAKETRPRSPPLKSPMQLEHIVPGKEKGRQDIADLGIVHGGVGVLDLVKQGLLHVEHLVLLVVVADVDLGAQADLAGVRGQHAR